MKKIKFTGKLSLNKETIAKLNDEQMSKVNGGEALATYNSLCCSYSACTTTNCATDQTCPVTTLCGTATNFMC